MCVVIITGSHSSARKALCLPEEELNAEASAVNAAGLQHVPQTLVLTPWQPGSKDNSFWLQGLAEFEFSQKQNESMYFSGTPPWPRPGLWTVDPRGADATGI